MHGFVLILEGETVTVILVSSRLELLEKGLANNFFLSYAEYNTSRPLNSERIIDVSLLRTDLATCKKLWGSRLWIVTDSLVLLTYAGLSNSRTLLQVLLSYLNLSLEREDHSVDKNKNDYYELRRQDKLLKATEKNEASFNNFDRGYVYQSNLDPLTKSEDILKYPR